MATFLSSIFNNAVSQRNARDQRAWQENMMDKQNRYNSPLAQSIRMRQAGLNPYQDMGAVPSASAGTGAMAQTLPINDPLSTAFTLSQIRNMDAETGKTETETDKILHEISNLELLYDKGLIEKDELEFRLEELKKAWSEKSQYQADLESTEADTGLMKAQTSETEERTEKTKSERLLADAQKQLADAQAEYQRVMTSNADKESKARVQKLYAEAAAAYAQAEASKSLSEKYKTETVNIDQQTWNMMNEEQRKAALHPYEVQLKQIAVEQGQTETEILKLQQAWQDYISARDEDGDFTLSSVFAKFLLDNVYVSISPGKGKGKSSE